jgi:RNA polymerase sigma-70 factor (ECF subfamily)
MGVPMNPTPLDLDQELRRHGGALRRLARELVRDGAAADDAVQETWLHAARRPPDERAQLGGWLATVLRRVVARSRRGERRRVERERAAVVGVAEPDHAEVAARAEIAQRLLAAVNELDAPYRDTIWQRYFEDLPPRAIAQRSGVPVATVKSRLQRGLQQLRGRLGEEGESDWRVALSAAFGFGEGAATVATAAAWQGGLLMVAWTKMAVAVGVVAVAALWWWWPEHTAQPMTTSEASSPAVAAAAGQTLPDPMVQRVAAEPPVVAELEAAAPKTEAGVLPAHVRGRVVAAETGDPLPGIEIYGSRSFGEVKWQPDHSLQVTAADGGFEFAVVAGKTPSLTMRGPDRVTCIWNGAILAPGRSEQIGDLPLPMGVQVRGRLVDESGDPVRLQLLLELHERGEWSDALMARGLRALGMQTRTSPDGTFVLPRLVGPGLCFWHMPLVGDYELVRPTKSEIPVDGAGVFDLTVRLRPTIRGFVVDESGAAIAGIGLADQQTPIVQVRTGDDGSFALTKMLAGDASGATVFVSDAGTFVPPAPIVDVAWGTQGLRIVLRRAPSSVVQVAAPDGSSIDDFGVVLDRPGLGNRRGKVQQRGEHDRGTLEVDGVVPGQTSLRVLPTSRTWTPTEPIAVRDGEPVGVVLQPRLPVTVHVVAAKKPVVGALVQLVRLRGVAPERVSRLLDPHGDEAWIPGRYSELVDGGRSDASGDVALWRDQEIDERCLLVRVEGRPAHIVRSLVFPPDGAPLVVELPALGSIVGSVELRGCDRKQVRVVLDGPNGAETTTLQSDGSFEFPGVPVGAWTVSLLRSPHRRMGAVAGSERGVDVQAGEAVQVRFDLADHPLGTIAGRLLADAPLPSGLIVDCIRLGSGTSPEVLGSGPVGGDGSFVVADLLPGTYRLAWRTKSEQQAWLPSLQGETLVLLPGAELDHRVPFRPRRLTVHFVRVDGTTAQGEGIRARCGDLHWPAILFFSPHVDGPLVLDPAPALPIEFRHRAEGAPWSASVVMPPDRSEAEVTVVLPDPPQPR